jgi:hypothetical protein
VLSIECREASVVPGWADVVVTTAIVARPALCIANQGDHKHLKRGAPKCAVDVPFLFVFAHFDTLDCESCYPNNTTRLNRKRWADLMRFLC